MDSFIKKIFNRDIDYLVHFQFVKFSKGNFESRAMIRAKNSSGKFSIATTHEYAKEIIITLAEKLGDNKTNVTGALISALDLDFDYDERKMAMGIRKYMLNREMTGKQILDLCNKLDKAFFGLSFKVGETELITSPKSPKSAKGAGSAKKEGSKEKIDFIKIKTTDKDLVDSLIFDDEAKDFNKIEIKHKFIIEDIIIPTGEKDFAKIRELAKRKGKIIRELNIDDKIIKKEIEFEA
jgi:hypothetical protein